MQRPLHIRPAAGKLGVLLPGMGAVATTFVAGVMLARRGLARPFGSLTQMATIRLGRRDEARSPRIAELVPLASLDDLVFGGWDLFPVSAWDAAQEAGVLEATHLAPIEEELRALRPWPAVFFPEYVRRLRGEHVKEETHRRALSDAVREDVRRFVRDEKLARCVAVWCGSTEAFSEPSEAHASLRAFEQALDRDDATISPSMIYAYACLKEGVPFANGSPNLSVETGALRELARERSLPISGKDFKTGQTLMKTLIAPGLRARMLGISGWFSTNILGNRDGEVLDDPESFRSKEATKLGVLETILQPHLHRELYGDMHHKVCIEYYRPRGDQKEGWDNIDLFGWLGYPMQLKVNFLCRDSILAAPVVLDVALFTDLAQRAGMSGVQEWLSFYYKQPMTAPGLYPENDLFVQLMKLKNMLRWMRGEDLITHLGQEYYD